MRCLPDPLPAGLAAPLVRSLLLTAGCAATLPALSQSPPQQVVRGPVATYWLTADTVSGMAAMGAGGGGLGALMGMMSGRDGAAQRTLDLRLGSTQAPSGPHRADHAIPPGMAMGRALPLVTPEPAGRDPSPETPSERSLPDGVEQPRGRMLIFWGCGETVGAGQPVVIDFSKLGPGQPMPALVSRTVSLPRGPSFGTSRSFGAWPNERDRQPIPAQASLRGEHLVQGTYSPDIRFTIERHDFMPPVALSRGPRGAAGAQPLTWSPVAGATGYFLSAFGSGGDGGGGTDIVLWTSSAVQETGGQLGSHLPPTEVARLVRERVILPPDRTECTVPAAVMQAMPMGMLSFTAHGDELNLAHPPRPQDPKVPWEIQWTVKLRLKSTTSMLLGQGMAGAPGEAPAASGTARSDPPGAAEPSAGVPPTAPAGSTPNPADAVGKGVEQGVRMLRGILGR